MISNCKNRSNNSHNSECRVLRFIQSTGPLMVIVFANEIVETCHATCEAFSCKMFDLPCFNCIIKFTNFLFIRLHGIIFFLLTSQ